LAEYPIIELSGPEAELDIAAPWLFESGCLGTLDSDGGRIAYFPELASVGPLVSTLRRRFPRLTCRVAPPLPARDWLAAWREALTGFSLGERYFVLPTWRSAPKISRTVLRIDPERAFGTGTHESTALAVELLERHVVPGARVIDVGAGTGILSMVAAHEGARTILALEPDSHAAACARANVAQNGLAERIDVETLGWEDKETLEADLVVANINTTILSRAVHRMTGRILLAGLLVDDARELIEALPNDARLREEWSAGEWAALVVDRGVSAS